MNVKTNKKEGMLEQSVIKPFKSRIGRKTVVTLNESRMQLGQCYI